MRTFTHKGYGRIYVEDAESIEKVKSVIRQIDEYEYTYMPGELITLYSEYPNVRYVHKFSDLDLDELTATCWNLGIKIWIFDSGHNEFPGLKL